jgi:PKD domain-containing protein
MVWQGVILDASGSTDPEGPIASYRWDLDGDGVYETDTALTSNVWMFFLGPGWQPVGLEVADQDGATATVRTKVGVYRRPRPTVDGEPPVMSFRRPHQSLGQIAKRGLRIRVGCSEPCRMGAVLVVDRRAARQLGLRSHRRRTMLSLAIRSAGHPGSRRLTLKPPRKARRRMRELHRLRVRLTAGVADRAGNVHTYTQRLTLRP